MRIRERRSIQATRQELTRSREDAIRAALPGTVREVSLATAVPEGRVRYALSTWHHQGKVCVCEWVRVKGPDGKFRVTPKFTAVPGYDVPPPEGVRRKGMLLKLEPTGAASLSIVIRKWFK